MVPAQPLMEDIHPDCKPHLGAEIVPDKDNNRSFVPTSDTKGSSCISKRKDATIKMEVLMNEENKSLSFLEDVDVDTMERRNNSGIRLAEVEDPDATENSSSFGNTVSDTENFSGFSEGEVESHFFGDNNLFDAFNNVFQMRKKKLTNHWRNFIRPVMWRCKWMELRIQELESQALRYSRELAEYDQGKHSGFDQFTLQEFGSKSLPFASQHKRKRAMKRMKRKRVEETTDVTSYMSHHNFFSHLENKRTDPETASVADDFVTTDQNADCNEKVGSGDDWTTLQFRDGDDSLEQVLWKIETVHTWVHKLKSQIDIVMSKNAAKFSSSENLSLLAPFDVQTSSAHSPAFSAGNGDAISAGAIYAPTGCTPEYDLGDLVMPGSVVSSFGEAISVPDIIESTVGLLSAADVTLHQPQFGDSSEDIVDNILLYDEAAETEKPAFQSTSNQPPEEKHKEPETCDQEGTNPFPIPSSEPDPTVKTVVSQEQSALQSCLASDVHFPRNKRKRGERKAGSVVWSKRCSGEPDSQ